MSLPRCREAGWVQHQTPHCAGRPACQQCEPRLLMQTCCSPLPVLPAAFEFLTSAHSLLLRAQRQEQGQMQMQVLVQQQKAGPMMALMRLQSVV